MDKLECLKTVNIGQSAAKPRTEERSETRLKSRRIDIKFDSKQEEDTYIYLLKEPKTGEIRYVGSTDRMPLLRIGEHFRFRDGTANKELQNWLMFSRIPNITILTYPKRLRFLAEKYWIRYYSNDNRLLNLSNNDNTQYGFLRRGRTSNPSKNRPCCKVSMDGEILSCYKSMTEASLRNKIHIGNIMKCVEGVRKTTGGYKWVSYDIVQTDMKVSE